MRALVTGCAGFIGSHLCEFLIEKGYEVIGVDNLYTGSKQNISSLSKEKFTFIKKDITKRLKIKGSLDEIYNLASPASPVAYQNAPLATMLTNSIGVKNTLDLALEKNAIFLQASTSEVYGNPLIHPQKESYFGNVNPVGPRACYDESKRFAEALTVNYSRELGVETRIARIFNTYGPRMQESDGRVIPNFITQALRNEPITVYGRGQQTRSFCYISDLISGLYKLMHTNYSMPVNIGNPKETKIIELAKLIKKLTESKSKIVFTEMPIDDPIRRKPDITLAKKLLKWKPKVTLKEGLKKTIKWFKEKCL
ncbi:MAG: SDR family NAD-dependent epimerase/dehydratase [Candidatus Iainarchaeum archaeon]|uniref:UDP-glucuronate decarboxylase n=1 Tax=Candidatus Iainarchaeum sp. TaxID=3101447 RepID=A0A497JHR7_9ARCH|nr:MAG: SDR family NAD-dependent epimerase/dehydratase [Candidatus Diapherotrites archaeon]